MKETSVFCCERKKVFWECWHLQCFKWEYTSALEVPHFVFLREHIFFFDIIKVTLENFVFTELMWLLPNWGLWMEGRVEKLPYAERDQEGLGVGSGSFGNNPSRKDVLKWSTQVGSSSEMSLVNRKLHLQLNLFQILKSMPFLWFKNHLYERMWNGNF